MKTGEITMTKGRGVVTDCGVELAVLGWAMGVRGAEPPEALTATWQMEPGALAGLTCLRWGRFSWLVRFCIFYLNIVS